MTQTASGTFSIQMRPHDSVPQARIGRMHFDKQWTGDLSGSSQGEMLSVGDPASGTASYVVLEVFTGTLAGRGGAFAFRQSGDMHAGRISLTYEIVPHSGGGDLSGISGSLTLKRVETVHHYELRYTPQPPEAPL